MEAIAISPREKVSRIVERPEPEIRSADEIKISVIEVGVCATDREEVLGGKALAPKGVNELVIGHEMFGVVADTGDGVRHIKPGDYGVFTVRRGCSRCAPCRMERPDMCRTGEYSERGIRGMDGFQTGFVVDSEKYFVPVPGDLSGTGVLTEPLSVAEKAISECLRLQSIRLPEYSPDWLAGKRCLVAGLGPIGLLAALVLTLRGGAVCGLDIVEPGSPKTEWLSTIGGKYIDGKICRPENIDEYVGEFDLVFEATGIPSLGFELIDALGINGIYVLTGIPGDEHAIHIPGSELMRKIVLRNQIIFGSVNASREHFQMAVQDLGEADRRWNGHAARLITGRYHFQDYLEPLMNQDAEKIKSVIEWTQ